MVIDEKNTGRHHLIDIVNSWFEYFWAKNKQEVHPLHTLILDFDDTILNSHGIQIDAWVDLVMESGLGREHFTYPFKDIRDNKAELRNKVSRVFFEQQDAKKILPEIFTGLEDNTIGHLHQRRFELRVEKMRGYGPENLFPNVIQAIRTLSRTYNLIIVSATDETEIIHYLKQVTIDSRPDRNLLHYFQYVFGKREPIFDWNEMKRKSQLIIKIINILGVPIERMLYIGDNNGDFKSANGIGLKFIEARLFEDELMEVTGSPSLIESNTARPVLKDWNRITDILDDIETGM
jgi:phosphoglycolate phosphatase-like HAD superfamily hydrolase